MCVLVDGISHKTNNFVNGLLMKDQYEDVLEYTMSYSEELTVGEHPISSSRQERRQDNLMKQVQCMLEHVSVTSNLWRTSMGKQNSNWQHTTPSGYVRKIQLQTLVHDERTIKSP